VYYLAHDGVMRVALRARLLWFLFFGLIAALVSSGGYDLVPADNERRSTAWRLEW